MFKWLIKSYKEARFNDSSKFILRPGKKRTHAVVSYGKHARGHRKMTYQGILPFLTQIWDIFINNVPTFHYYIIQTLAMWSTFMSSKLG